MKRLVEASGPPLIGSRTLGLLMSAAGIAIDKGTGLFQHIGQMQEWRNLVTHASPYEIEPTEIPNTVGAPLKLHQQNRNLEYAGMADAKNKKFYETAVAYIDLVKERTGLDPRAMATYKSWNRSSECCGAGSTSSHSLSLTQNIPESGDRGFPYSNNLLDALCLSIKDRQLRKSGRRLLVAIIRQGLLLIKNQELLA